MFREVVGKVLPGSGSHAFAECGKEIISPQKNFIVTPGARLTSLAPEQLLDPPF